MQLSLDQLNKYEEDAKICLSRSCNSRRIHPNYILIKADDLLAMIKEIKELRDIAKPDAILLTYFCR